MRSVRSLFKTDKNVWGTVLSASQSEKSFIFLKACRIESNSNSIKTDYKQHDKMGVIKFATGFFL